MSRIITSSKGCPFCGSTTWMAWVTTERSQTARPVSVDEDLPNIDCEGTVGEAHYLEFFGVVVDANDYHDECCGCGAVLS